MMFDNEKKTSNAKNKEKEKKGKINEKWQRGVEERDTPGRRGSSSTVSTASIKQYSDIHVTKQPYNKCRRKKCNKQ